MNPRGVPEWTRYLPQDVRHFELVGGGRLALLPGATYWALTADSPVRLTPARQLTPEELFARELAKYRPFANRQLRRFARKDRGDIIALALSWAWEHRAQFDPSRASAGTWFIQYALPEGRRQFLIERKERSKELATDPQVLGQTLRSDSDTLRQLIAHQGVEQILLGLEREFPPGTEGSYVLDALMSDDYARDVHELLARRRVYDNVRRRIRELSDEWMPDEPESDPDARDWSSDMPGTEDAAYHRPDRMAKVMGDWSWRSPDDRATRLHSSWRPHVRSLRELVRRAQIVALVESWVERWRLLALPLPRLLDPLPAVPQETWRQHPHRVAVSLAERALPVYRTRGVSARAMKYRHESAAALSTMRSLAAEPEDQDDPDAPRKHATRVRAELDHEASVESETPATADT
jgi:hypothetical protein